MKKRLLWLAMISGTICAAQRPARIAGNIPVAVQWHFNGQSLANIPAPNDGEDWVYNILPTDRKQYIAVGYTTYTTTQAYYPSILKLDNFGKVVWSKPIISAANTPSPDNAAYSAAGSYFKQVIKTPAGYAAVGVAQSNKGNRAIIVEFDEDGNVLRSQLFNAYGSTTGSVFRAETIALEPGNRYLYIGGGYVPSSTSYKLQISKIDYSSFAMLGTYTEGANPGTTPNVYGGSEIFRLVIAGTASSYKIFGTGFESVFGKTTSYLTTHDDNTIYPNTVNRSGLVAPVCERNKDIVLLSLDENLALNFSHLYDKESLKNSPIHYTETGPFSARDMATDITKAGYAGNHFIDATAILKADNNNDERGYDIRVTNDGQHVIVAALINHVTSHQFLQGNNNNIVETVNANTMFVTSNSAAGFRDPKRSNYYYDDYSDGDAYLLKFDLSGNMDWAKNVAHMSSKDFFPQVFQNKLGNYIVSGSTADYFPAPLPTPESYDAIVLETPDAPAANAYGDAYQDHIWRRWFHAEDVNGVGGGEENMCNFTLAETADGGFVIGGDNTPYTNPISGTNPTLLVKDRFSITKCAPYCAPKTGTYAYAINQKEYDITTNTTWPDATVQQTSNLATKVVVKAGATLHITGCTLSFASSDHITDYWDFPTAIDNSAPQMCGIMVEPGGHLIIDHSTLKGLDECQPGSLTGRFMWDGIAVSGNPKLASQTASQGWLEMTGSSVLDARVGAYADFTYRNSSKALSATNLYTTNTSSSAYSASGKLGGGIIAADHSNLQDCRFAVRYSPAPGQLASLSRFQLCNFTATAAGMADPCFYTAPDGGRLPSSTMFASAQANYISLLDNNFYCDNSFDPHLWPIGINLWDAGVNIARTSGNNGNIFTNLHFGVSAAYTPGFGSATLNLYGNFFDNCGSGLNVANGYNNLYAQSNSFHIPGSVYNSGPYPQPSGMILETSTGYHVYDNEFAACQTCAPNPPSSRGLQVSWGSSYNSNTNILRFNKFYDLSYPVVALQRNSNGLGDQGLEFRCNTFQTGNFKDVSRFSGIGGGPLVAATMRKTQGSNNATNPQPAENLFLNSCGLPTNKRLYADAYTAQQVQYFWDPVNANWYDPSGCMSSKYTASSTSALSLGSNVCDPSGNVRDPEYPLRKLHDAQVILTGTNPTSDDYPFRKADVDGLVSASVLYYGYYGFIDSAAKLLDNYGRYSESLPFYMQEGDWTSANNAWAHLPLDSTDDQQFSQLARMSIDLYSHDKTWADLDSAGMAYVTSLAPLNTYPGYMAAAITDMLGTGVVNWPLVDFSGEEGGGNGARFASTATNVNYNSLKIYPNPTKGTITIESAEDGSLTFSNVQGQQVAQLSIKKGKVTTQIPVTLPAGIYMGKFTGKETGNNLVIKLVYNP